MPELEQYFHYRYLDVSILKELTRLKPELLDGLNKKGSHLSLMIFAIQLMNYATIERIYLQFDG